MTLRRRLVVYLVVVHLVLAALAFAAFRNHRLWLPATEALLLASALIGAALVRGVTRPLELLRQSALSLKAGDFTTRLRPTGPPELDALVALYNEMVDFLRAERVRGEEQEQFLRRILAASPLGVVTLDLDGRVLTANRGAEALLGAAESTLRGRRLGELGTPFARALATVPAGGTEVLALQGARRVRAHHLGFPDRGFTRSFLLVEELTEELRRSEKAAYDRLIRIMSHEVNNTSGAVSSMLESCLNYRDQLSPADRADFVAALDVAGARLSRMNAFMRHFADVVRLPPPRLEPLEPGLLVERIERIMRPSAERAGVIWRRACDAAADPVPLDPVPLDPVPLDPVPLDPVQMEQALINIVKNAIEAASESRTPGAGAGAPMVEIRLERIEGVPWLSVRDNGPGLTPEASRQIFTPFFTTRENGQGIGLTLVREILIGHGFEFALEHAAGWTEFRIRLRRSPSPGEGAGPPIPARTGK